MTRPTAFVLNMYATGLGIARNLAPHGVHVVGISSQEDVPGAHSRYCRALTGPDSAHAPEELAEFLIGLARLEPVQPILFATRDADVEFIDRFREPLEAEMILTQPAHELLDALVNKARLAELAERHGVDSPVTLSLSSAEELEQNAGRLPFPAVVKPVYAAELPGLRDALNGQKGLRVDDRAALDAVAAKAFAAGSRVLVQEWVDGEADEFYIVGLYIGAAGRCLGAFTSRKLVQYPPGFGLGCLYRTVDLPELRDSAVAFLEGIGYRGLAEVEYKRDPESGRFRLIEINTRHWDQHPMGTAAGVNLSLLAYRDLAEGAAPDEPCYPRRRSSWIRGLGLLRAIKAELRHGSQGMLMARRALSPSRRAYALWSWSDPMPVLRRRKPGA
ncbi:hypothetical protein ABI59_18890 [Acidobacteria bacterium Mor1]|nr:hypothetical protein ABI59_18890 [Acidobacteria bacterium Mor1]